MAALPHKSLHAPAAHRPTSQTRLSLQGARGDVHARSTLGFYLWRGMAFAMRLVPPSLSMSSSAT